MLLKGKIHLAVQTCGYAPADDFDKILSIPDYVLYDLKFMSSDMHKKYCGADNAFIKRNYKVLSKSGVPFVTGVTLIPGLTDTEENFSDIARFMSEKRY